MRHTTSSTACFSHVVFPEPQHRPRRVLDLSARGPGRFVPVGDRARRAPAPRVAANASSAPQDVTDERLSFEEQLFLEWLFSSAGLDPSLYRQDSLSRRLPACLRAVGAPTVRQARRAIEKDPELHPAALNAMLIGVTSFFRDPQVFSALVTRVIPVLSRGQGVVRAWSAGCSDGLELYSLAILLAEFGLLERSRLLGTDCRRDAVDRARGGRFPAAAVRSVHSDWVERYFTPTSDQHFRVREEFRASAEWRCEDLLRNSGADDSHEAARDGEFDLILCRNVAIYLTPETCHALWRRLYAALRPGGVLVTGKAERPSVAGLELLAPCLFRKDGRAA